MPAPPPPDRAGRSRLLFVILCTVAVGVAVGYILWTRDTPSPPRSVETPLPSTEKPRPGAETSPPSTGKPAPPETTAVRPEVQTHRFVMFRDTSLGTLHGRVMLRSLDSSESQTTTLSCERVHFASGRGVCLRAKRGFVTVYDAVTFGSTFVGQHTISLAGVPSRVRVSPDGARAGITVFVSGDSYAPGSFSTRTTIVDTHAGTTLGDLEQFSVTRDGTPFKAVDFNFWGLTFASKGKVYATLGTGGRTYLVAVDVDAGRAEVIHEGVECPSLSPDGSRIAFKKRTSAAGRLLWRLHVLDLRTGKETALAEPRSVDDQAEWRDSGMVTYGLPSEATPGSTDVWGVPADGSGAPVRLFEAAWSPAFAVASAPPTAQE